MIKNSGLEKNIILFIDDEKICHTLVNLIIPNFTKYRIINAYNGVEAINFAQRYKNNICLVLSDIMLPDINGYEIYSILKKDESFKDVPFIFQSGLVSQEKELKKLIEGEINIIYKPYKQSDLVHIIQNVLS